MPALGLVTGCGAAGWVLGGAAVGAGALTDGAAWTDRAAGWDPGASPVTVSSAMPETAASAATAAYGGIRRPGWPARIQLGMARRPPAAGTLAGFGGVTA